MSISLQDGEDDPEEALDLDDEIADEEARDIEDEIVELLDKREEFRQAIHEITGQVSTIAGLRYLPIVTDMKVRPFILKKDVPLNIITWATTEARKYVETKIKSMPAQIEENINDVKLDALYEDRFYDTDVYGEEEPEDFVNAFDRAGLRALARNGVFNFMQNELEDKTNAGFSGISEAARFVTEKSPVSRIEQLALTQEIVRAADYVIENLERLREEDLGIIQTQSPAYSLEL